ncbi:HlyC/CorC family transporter [Colwellia psychrerythraea]|uniref:Magnesium and cobalt efflux protein CorC n=1 Tax=Colwellia psychrerythraea TaxID=28229 RepID=A0A099KR53_COLPS|nr:transporter associated domain-containing protein [Colwellia psychrerythraea]KGJ93001.1 putative signal transduction protein with CBS domain containing protein [Colwellia psychrerythraea]
MSDDTPHSSNGSANKSFLHKVMQVLTPEPKNKDQLVDILNDAQDRDLINPETKQMITGVLDVSEMRVREIMIPRSQMVTIDINHDLDEFLPIILESGHSRFPVVNEDIDHVEGILLAKDLLAFSFNSESKDFSLREVIRPAIIVPESKKVEPLLKEFRSNRYHMAIVVDEYGGVSGLITIEDILEQIVGEIEDETDDEIEEEIKHLAGNVYLVKALTELSDFNEYFNSDFDEANADTIGGIVLRQFNHMPQKGELFRLGNFEFKVLVADSRRMQMLQVSVDKDHEINGKVSD